MVFLPLLLFLIVMPYLSQYYAPKPQLRPKWSLMTGSYGINTLMFLTVIINLKTFTLDQSGDPSVLRMIDLSQNVLLITFMNRFNDWRDKLHATRQQQKQLKKLRMNLNSKEESCRER